MTRPSNNTDQLLIEAARKLIPLTGCTGLSIRKVADQAGVNLGMFHYHFKSKSEFTHRVLKEVYEDFFQILAKESSPTGTPEEQLRMVLWTVARFSRDQRALIVALLRDILNGDDEVLKFAKENFGRHIQILLSIIRECKKTGTLQDISEPMALVILIGSIVAPHLILDILDRAKALGPFGIKRLALQKLLLSETALSKRIELALQTVLRSPEKGR